MPTPQTITVAPFAPSLADFTARRVAVAAVASSGLAVAYSVSGAGASIDPVTGVLSASLAGTAVVSMDQAGNGTFSAAATVTLTIVTPAITATDLQAHIYSAAGGEENLRLGFLLGYFHGAEGTISQAAIDRLALSSVKLHTAAGRVTAAGLLAA